MKIALNRISESSSAQTSASSSSLSREVIMHFSFFPATPTGCFCRKHNRKKSMCQRFVAQHDNKTLSENLSMKLEERPDSPNAAVPTSKISCGRSTSAWHTGRRPFSTSLTGPRLRSPAPHTVRASPDLQYRPARPTLRRSREGQQLSPGHREETPAARLGIRGPRR